MRYRIGEVTNDSAYASSNHFVELTVYITLLIGIGFLVAGIFGKQSWLTVWGGLTIIVCGGYFVAQYLGWFQLL